MSEIKQLLIQLAKEKTGEITPPNNWPNFENCFTEHEGSLMFWYNDSTGNTKVEAIKIK